MLLVVGCWGDESKEGGQQRTKEAKIGEILLSPQQVEIMTVNETRIASVSVENPGARKLEFYWETTGGTINRGTNPAAIKYRAPDTPGTYKLWVQVREGEVLIAAREREIQVVEAPQPYDVLQHYIPSGWMGDGEQGTRYVVWAPAWPDSRRPDSLCVRITYEPGPRGFAGIYLQWPENNWGDRAGRDLRGYRRITFWARAEQGGNVEFKAGDIDAPGKHFRDSFEASLGTVHLTGAWTQYTIDLQGCDLSCVIGGFCWVATTSANPQGLIFYLDDIFYEE